jgi:lactate permease
MNALVAALPLVAVLGALGILRVSAAAAAALGLVVAAGVLLLAGGPSSGGAPFATGVAAEAGHAAATILWIILPALALHEYQTRTGGADRIRAALARLTTHPGRKALLIAWFFGLFVEGAAGFGTPVALAAPLLVGVGFAPVTAVTLALVGHAAGVAFGAVGTPTLTQADLTGLSPVALAGAIAGANLLLALVPLAAVVALSRQGRVGRGDLVWAAFAGAAFLGPHWVLAKFAGPELATLGAALAGMALFVAALRRFEPRQTDTFDAGDIRRLAADLAPYLGLIVLVLVTRLVPDVRAALSGWSWAWTLPGDFGASFAPLFHPGTLLMVALVVGAVVTGRSIVLVPAVGAALRRLGPVALALVLMLGLSRLMVHGGMISALADGAAGAGAAWPVVAAGVGVLGTFVTGSATASNILFAEFQTATAAALGMSALWLSAAQGLGAAIGNVVAPHNIIAGCATVGLARAEGAVLRRSAPVCGIYFVACGVLFLWLA